MSSNSKYPTAYGKPVKMGVVNAAKLYIRQTPDVSSDTNILGVLDQGTKLFILRDNVNLDFMKVRLSDGTEGFVMKRYVLSGEGIVKQEGA